MRILNDTAVYRSSCSYLISLDTVKTAVTINDKEWEFISNNLIEV